MKRRENYGTQTVMRPAADVGWPCVFFVLLYLCRYDPWTIMALTACWGSFLGTQTLVPFIISTAAMCAGLILCFYVAFHKDNKDK